MESAIAKGRDLPDWYLDEPLLWEGDDFYIREFWKLHTTRQIGGSTYGPIPIPEIERRGECRYGFSDEDLDLYVSVIHEMDVGGFLKWQGDAHAKTVRRQEFESRRKPGGGRHNLGGKK